MKNQCARMTMTFLLAALLGGGCNRPAPVDPHAGHNHGPGEGHGAKPPVDGGADEHAGHDHGPGGHAEAEGVEMCGEHGVPEAECGICNPDGVADLKPGESLLVRLPGDTSAELAGVRSEPAQAGPAVDVIACHAEFTFDQNRLAEVGSPAGGIIREVAADWGDRVAEGQVLARIWSAGIEETVARAVLSHQTLVRERQLHAEGIAPAKDLQQAEADHRVACRQARTLGFTEADIDAMGRAPDAPALLDVRAPFAGEVIERAAVRGALTEPGRMLFTLADRSTMWAMLQVPEAQLARLRVGQAVELEVEALAGHTFTGRLSWIAAQVDERTRMARARAEVVNPDGLLRDRMFARARIVAARAERAVQVPGAAVQRVGTTPIVFVRQAADLYEARVVRLGAAAGGVQVIAAGLRPDEPVVVDQAFVVKSQLLMSRLGAGCAHE